MLTATVRWRLAQVVWVCALTLAAIVPAPAFAQGTTQASIAGVVTDTSGAVLPGVTVEASSPALIEKVRSTVTDGSGQYRIIELRPGPYAVTFTIQGFNVVRREGVELAGTITATVNAEMRVGALEETVTVTGESPIVDVQNARRGQVIDSNVVTNIPNARLWNSIAILVPGLIVGGGQDVGGVGGSGVRNFSSHGGRGNEGRLLIDGVGVGANSSGTSN